MFQNLTDWHFIVEIFVLLFSLVIHELAHAVTADALGDKTARLQGRLTLNPLAHLELIGLIAILFAPIGWARPVPINPRNFKNPRRAVILVTAAGPVANLVLACIGFFIIRIAGFDIQPFLLTLLGYIAMLNISLFVFNLIPLPPLDGSQILRNLLPLRAAVAYSKLDLYGPFILLLLLIVPFVGRGLYVPLVQSVSGFVASWFGLA